MEKTYRLIANISTSDTSLALRNRARVKYWPFKRAQVEMEDLYYGTGMEKTYRLIANISISDTSLALRNRARVKYWPLKRAHSRYFGHVQNNL